MAKKKETHSLNGDAVKKVLEAGEVDFAVGMLPTSLRELRHRLLFRDRIICVARAGHWAIGRTLSAGEFCALEHVVIMPNTVNCFGEVVDQALAAQGLARNRRFVTPNYLTAPHLLEKTDMVALLPQSLAVRFQERFGLAELALPVQVPEFEVYISWHDRTHRHAAHIWFRDQVRQSLDLNAQGPDWAYATMPAFNK